MKKILSLILSLSILSSLIGIVSVGAEDGYDYFVEAEQYSETNWRSTGGGTVQSKSVYSSGKYLNLFYDIGAGAEYYAEYNVECKEAGVYTIDIATTPLDEGWSSPIYLSVNGGDAELLAGASFKSIAGDTNIKWYRVGMINLREGVNSIRFLVREGRESDGKATCFFDCFGLTQTEYSLREIKSPAPLQTFQQGEKLEFEIYGQGVAPQDMPISYDVIDFEGKFVDGGNVVLKKNEQTVGFSLKPKKNGAYQIIANCNGKTIVQQFLVVTNLKDRKKLDDSPFGLDALMYGMRNDKNSDLVEDYADLLELSGITWTRDRVYFDNYVKKEGNKFTFSMPHTKVTGDLLAERGIKVLQTMDLSSSVIRPSDDYGDYLPTNLFDVYNFWKQLAERYDGAVTCWEIQNESDLGGGGSNKDGPDAYSSMFKAAAIGIMDSNTQNEVFISPFGAAAGPNHKSQHVGLMFENDIYDYTNIANFHHHTTAVAPYDKYVPFPTEGASPTNDYIVGGYLDLGEEHGFALSQWNSESGVSLDIPVGVDYDAEEQMVQAKFLVTSYAEELSAGADKKFFFDGISYQEGSKSWGMMNRSLTSPSAYAAYGSLSAMTHVLGEGISLGRVKAPEGVLAYAFADGEDTAIVYYSTSKTGEKYNFDVNTGKQAVRHFDIFANEDRIYSQNGIYTLTAEDSPQYIKFTGRLSDDCFTADVVDEYITIGDTQKSVDAGKRVVILQKYETASRTNARQGGYSLDKETNGVDVEVFNFNNFAVNGVINGESANGWKIEPASQAIEIAPMTSATVHFEVIPDTFKSQEDRITFYGDMDCGRTTDSVIRALGAQVVDFQPKIADGERFVTVRINNSSNIQKVVRKANVVVNDYESESTETVVIEPKEVVSFDIPTKFSDTDKSLAITAEIEFTDGTKANHSGETQFAVAKRAIDLSGTPGFILPDDGDIKTPYYYGVDDLYGEFYVAADEDNFYFAGKVKDNTHSAPQTGYNIWQNDGIQFSIGKGLPGPSIPYYELGMSLTNKGVSEAYCWSDPDKAGNGKLEGVDCTITRDEKTMTTTYRIAIPWEIIPRISYDDGMAAFSMLINENDGGGRNGYLEWGSGIGASKNSSQFRTIVFDK